MVTLISTMRNERQIVNITTPGQNFKTKISNWPASFQLDRAVNLDRKPNSLHCQRHFCRQYLVLATASRTAFSISRCEVMPTFLRNLRTLTLKTSSFMIASPKCRKDGAGASL
jgi:hypothetical protein